MLSLRIVQYCVIIIPFLIICSHLSLQCGESDVDKIQISPVYLHGIYQFKGNVTTEFGTNTIVYNFNGKATRDTFELDWNQRDGDAADAGRVIIRPNVNEIQSDGKTDQYDTPALAIASATGVSGSSANLLYSLWTGDRKSIFPSLNASIRKNDNGQIIVTGNKQSEARRIELNITNGMLSMFTMIYDPKLDGRKNIPNIMKTTILLTVIGMENP